MQKKLKTTATIAKVAIDDDDDDACIVAGFDGKMRNAIDCV